MRKIYALLVLFLMVGTSQNALSQCACAGTDYGSLNVAGWTVGQSANIATNIYAGERSTILNTVAGAVYRVSTCGASYDTQLSIYTTGCGFLAYNDDNGPACSGTRASVDFTSPGGNIYAKLNQYNCATNSTNTTVSVTLISLPAPAGCTNSTPFGTANAPGPGVTTTITTCIFAGEYSTINSVDASTQYISSSDGPGYYITIRQGTFNGPVIAAGNSPLTWTSTVAGTYFQHVNTNSACGTAFNCHTNVIEQPIPPMLVPFSGNNSFTVCSGNLYDHGGPSGNYANNANGFTVLNPSTPGNLIQVSGTTSGEGCCDFLTIFDGVGTGGTVLWTGVANAGAVPLVTSSTGPLTVRFTSDGSVVGAGFALNVACVAPPPPSPTSVTASTSTLCDNALAPVTLTANGSSGTVYWFTSGCNTSGWIATGNPIVVNPTTTTTYFARNFDGTQWSTACASTTVTVNPAPTGVSAGSSVAICELGSTPLNALPGPTGCDIAVTMSSPSWGDATTWELRNASNIVVLSGGPYGNGYNQTLTLNNATNGPFTLQITSTLGDNIPNYSVSVNSVVQYSGTAPANQTTTIGPINCPAPLTYSWSPTTGLNNPNIQNPIASPSVTTNYTVTVTSNGCSTTSSPITVTVNLNPTADAGPALAAICQSGTSAAMGGSVGGGATGGTWSGGAGTWTNAGDPANATYTASAGESGTITLTLTTSGGSCGTTSVSKTIVVNPNPTADAGPALAAICQSGTSAAMGGSVGGGATGGTWSGGAGTWTNANDPANATYTASAGESGTITLTLTTSGGSCGTTFDTKSIVVDAASVAATSINNLNPVICHGGSMQLEVVGGSLAAGAQWEWFEGSCGSTVIGTGASISVTPSGATDYFVRATSANSCAPTSCTDISVTMPTTSTNLAINGDVATCVVNSGNWIHFYDVNGRLIASVNSNGQNLGNVTATSLVAGAPSTVTSCTQPWDPSWFNTVLARTFEISPTTQPTNPVSVRLYISDAEFNDYQNYAASVTTGNLNDDVGSISDMGLTKHSGSGVNGDPANICDAGVNIYVPQSGSGNTSTLFSGFSNSYFVEYSITGFSSFFPMNSGNSPLPVTMTSFNANCDEDKVNIRWTTASEYNASHFSVQTSRDGQNWTEVAQIEAAGTSNQTTNYFYQDMMIGGVSYYRLVQVDFDGEYEVFGPISIDCEISESSMTVYPNPTDADFTVLIQTTETFENATIELVDLSGRSVQVKEMNIAPGSTMIKFETDNINPGTYIVRIKGENDKFTPIRVVIL